MQSYQEYPPHPALARYVACLWTGCAVPHGGAPVRMRVLPDNCIDILWRDDAPLGVVAGMMSKARRVETAQRVTTVAVRFLPGAARAVFDLPLHLLQDGHPGLAELWPRAEAERLAEALWAREHTAADRLATVERWLIGRLRGRRAMPADQLVRAAVARVEASGGAVRIDDLAQRLGVSRQHLALLFRERVGLNAKTFALVCRFRRATAALRRHADADADADTGVDWVGLAGACGYYDQAHLIHAFRLFADETPASFHFSNTRRRPAGMIELPPTRRTP